MKNKLNMIMLLCVILLSCNKEKDMSNKTDFSWVASVTSIKDYPIEVHKGFLATHEKFITALHSSGIEDSGWKVDGQGGGGGNIIPTMLSLTWVSYAEKKFWNIETTIDQATQNKMLALFREGFYNWDRVKEQPKHDTYNHITIAVAPGGIVVLFITGNAHRVEVARYQAKETLVNVNAFVPVPGAFKDLNTFFDVCYKDGIAKYLQEKIAKTGIPYGIWDTYREKYNWRFQTFFYKEDTLTDIYVGYINGEADYFNDDELSKKLFSKAALPLNIRFYFKIYNGEAKFDEEEIVAAFKKMKKNHPEKNIEIEAKIGFMYKTTTFTVKCEDEEIPLEKTVVKMYKN
ncbi:DUF2931 family protein [Flavobacterium sp. FlaQc-47]|uniref:DUF2931 family protein n=1 Tax=Flavobacterium sp. FlaQc-47 TaxID=3374180 RepID=UPI003756BB73